MARGGSGREASHSFAPVGRTTQAGIASRHYQSEAVGSDGGGPLARTADISHVSSHNPSQHTHRQPRFSHGRIKCCPNASDVRTRHRKVTPRRKAYHFKEISPCTRIAPPDAGTASTPANRTTPRARQRPPLEAHPERNRRLPSASTVITTTGPLTRGHHGQARRTTKRNVQPD